MTTVLYPNCTHAPPTNKRPTREIQEPYPACTADSQEDTKLRRLRENRRKDEATTSREDPTKQPTGEAPRRSHGTHTGKGATKLQGPWQRPQEHNTIKRNHTIMGQRIATDCTDTTGKRSRDPNSASRGERETTATRTHRICQPGQTTRPTPRQHSGEEGEKDPVPEGKNNKNTTHRPPDIAKGTRQDPSARGNGHGGPHVSTASPKPQHHPTTL